MAVRGLPIAPVIVLVFVSFALVRCEAQIRYASGQNVVPVYEGWERNPDDSFNMVFGYMNRNYEEEVDVPIGPENMIEPGGPDQGQPAHFYLRRQEFVFKVKVPKDWGEKDIVWTLQSHGKVEKAYGSLIPVWELSTLVYLENRRGAGALTFPEEPNKAPSIEMIGSSQRTAIVGEPITLSVDVSDDGYPVPFRRRARAAGSSREGKGSAVLNIIRAQSPASQAVVKLDPGVRLGVTWVLYRGGPGNVTFDPMRTPVVSADTGGPPGPGLLTGRTATEVTFSEPGTYRLRAYADDSVLTTVLDVTVTVQPASSH
jgi:hypothetical protein